MPRRRGRAAVLRALAGDIDLDEHIDRPVLLASRRAAALLGVLLELLGEAQRVDRVDQAHGVDGLLDLVPLQRADHVPAHRRDLRAPLGAAGVELLDDRRALHELLHAVLAEVDMPERDELADVLDRCVLGDGDEHDLARPAAGPLGGARDAATHILVALAQGARVGGRGHG